MISLSRKIFRDYRGLIFFSLTIFFFPILPLLFILFLISVFTNFRNSSVTVFIILIFTLLNFTRSIDSDWENYLIYYKDLKNANIFYFFEEQFLTSVRITEPLFYVFSWVLSSLFNSNIFIFILCIVLLIYCTYYLSFKILMNLVTNNSLEKLITIIIAFTVCLNFTESIHLVRQYISGSLLFYSFVLLISNRILRFYFICIIGFLFHNSLIVPLAILFITYIIIKYLKIWEKSANRINSIFFIPVIVGLLFGLLSKNYLFLFSIEADKNENTVYISMILEIFCFITCVIYFLNNFRKALIINNILILYIMFFISYVTFLIIIRENSLLFQRFYLYLEWFRIVFIFPVIYFSPKIFKSHFVFIFIIFLSILFLLLRIYRSPWQYLINSESILCFSFLDLIKFLF